jgi:acetyltransferase-like isoleucine patch superfamily enzyme
MTGSGQSERPRLSIARIVRAASRNPLHAVSMLGALLRGTWYIWFYRLWRRNVIIRFPFKAFTKVTIVGPGSVFIDRHCAVHKNLFKGLSIVTLSSDARIWIGRQCNLGGLAIRCRRDISIGDRTMTAYSLLQDDLFMHDGEAAGIAIGKVRSDTSITIGCNVWIAAQSVVLGGSDIREDTVMSSGSACSNFFAPAYSLVMGNPAKRPMPISRALVLRGEG